MLIQSTPTNYEGYSFRSRLEARWAVYFDAIGLDWCYELEGYQLPSGWYLPDFWLPQVELWAEVKPTTFSETESRKVHELVQTTRFGCLMLEGIPQQRPVPVVEYCDVYKQTCLDDAVISMYHQYPLTEKRFYGSTGPMKFPQDQDQFDSMFDDVELAVKKAKLATFR